MWMLMKVAFCALIHTVPKKKKKKIMEAVFLKKC